MHCTDEQLISYLDGELTVLTRIGVRTHLERCWRCRGRLSGYEREVVALTEATDHWSFPAPDWKSKAKSRLNVQLEDLERTLPARGSRRCSRTMIGICAGIAAAVVCAMVLMPRVRPPSIDAFHAIERAASAENALFRPAVKEQVAVVVEEIRSGGAVRRSRLEAISDSGTGRYKSDLRSDQGVLKQALWRPDNQSEYVYQAGNSAAVAKRSAGHHHDRLIDTIGETGLEAEQVEASFVRWLESRSWRPISLSADLALLSHRDDTLLRMERITNPAGVSVLRVTASRTTDNQVVARVTLEIDAASYRPKLETLQLEQNGRQIELRLSVTAIEEVPPATLAEVTFRPPPSTGFSSSRPEPVPETILLSAPASNRPAVRLRDLDGTVRALYALHQAGACLGTGVEISEGVSGVIVRERNGIGSDPRRFVAPNATLAEALNALSDIRSSIQAVQPTSRIRLNVAALKLIARMSAPHSPPLSEPTRDLLRTMFHEHAALLNHDQDASMTESTPDN